MSLLMQALKKAERAKQTHLRENGLLKPSEELDRVLTIMPVGDAAPDADLSSLSLSPLETEPPLLDQPWQAQGAAAPTAASDRGRASAGAELPPYSSAEAPAAAPRQRTAPPAKAKPVAVAPRGFSIDPQTGRLAILGGVALLILCLFAYLYWRAVNAPGAGSNLPMVPMPPPDATTPAAGALLVMAPPAGEAVPVTDPVSAKGRPPVAETAPAPDAPLSNDYAAQSNSGTIPATAAPGDQAPSAGTTATGKNLAPAGFLPGMELTPEPERRASASTPDHAGDGADYGGIRIRAGDNMARVNPLLQQAYQAFSAGDLGSARQQYESVLRQDPTSRDALLGVAAAALRENQAGMAAGAYLRLLELDPNDSEAVAGLISLRHGDPGQSESRLKAILQRSPEAGPALFALGNLYAQQGRWADAQQTFFRAYTSAPANPDYAFNLAVGLDRLNQPRGALEYYQRAQALASNAPGSFDAAALRRRMQELSGALSGAAPEPAPGPSTP